MRPIDTLREKIDLWKKSTTDTALMSVLHEVLQQIDVAIYEMDHQEAASPWRRVEDGDFPKNDESVFVYCETTGGIIKSTYHEFVKDGERIYWAFGGQLRKYWMPLPEPPKEDA